MKSVIGGGISMIAGGWTLTFDVLKCGKRNDVSQLGFRWTLTFDVLKLLFCEFYNGVMHSWTLTFDVLKWWNRIFPSFWMGVEH